MSPDKPIEQQVEDAKQKKMPRTFMSPAFLKVIEKNTYGLYRSVEVETFDRKRGYPVRESAGEIGPIRVLREMETGEEGLVVLETFHPIEKRMMKLVEVT
jgi:hypothetical protein